MSDLNLSSACVMSVIRSWETARQRNGFDETLGIDTLLLLFKMDPQIKQIFGFPVDKEVKAEGMQRMGILIHGLRIIKMLDLIFSVLGPDPDILQDVLADMGDQHCKLGLSPDHFTLLCRALLEVLEKIMGDEWNSELRSNWFQVIRALSVEIAKCMQKRMSKVCQKLTLDDMRGGQAVGRGDSGHESLSSLSNHCKPPRRRQSHYEHTAVPKTTTTFRRSKSLDDATNQGRPLLFSGSFRRKKTGTEELRSSTSHPLASMKLPPRRRTSSRESLSDSSHQRRGSRRESLRNAVFLPLAA